MAGLFRNEAVNAQSQRLEGTVSLAQPLSVKIATLLILTITTIISLFLFNAHYTRKESVQGFLRPDKGMIKIYSARNGSIEHVYVKAGDTVTIGMPLVRIVSHIGTVSGEELSERLVKELASQLVLLDEEIQQRQKLEMDELQRIDGRIQNVTADQKMLHIKQDLAKKKLELTKEQTLEFSDMYDRGYMSALEYRHKQQIILDARQAIVVIERELLQQDEALAQLHHEKKQLPEQSLSHYREIAHKKSDLNRNISEIQTSHRHIITSTHTGIVASIAFLEGETVNLQRPLLKILPQDTQLVAELLLPTRSAGFVKTGDTALLRLDAFPHQRFGFVNSTITQIDTALVTQAESALPVPLQEPVYRLLATLDHQFVQSYGREFPLKSGMMFQADIILETRSLIDWIFDPIYNLNARLL